MNAAGKVSETKIPDLTPGTAQPWNGTLDNSIEMGDLKPLRERITASEVREKELREENERLTNAPDFTLDSQEWRNRAHKAEAENASLRAQLAGTQAALQSVQDQRNFLGGRTQDLEHRLEEMQRPVSDEQGERSFTVWNGWIKGALRWRELEPYEQNRWKAAIGAARAAKGGE